MTASESVELGDDPVTDGGQFDAGMFSEDFVRDPHPMQARLRVRAPVYRTVTPLGAPVWVVTRYEDARAALADSRLSKDAAGLRTIVGGHFARLGLNLDLTQVFAAHMNYSDPPNHTRLRRLVSKAFTVRRVTLLRPRVEQITDELLDAIDGRAQADLMDALAFPLPTTVICELLGIPGADQDQFRLWIETVLGASLEESAESSRAMADYMRHLITAKRAEPADDLLSALIEATEEGDRLSEPELVATIFQLVVAGHETSMNFIGNGLLSLLLNPGQHQALLADRGLLPGALEEFLRFEGSVNLATHRFTAEPVEIAGTVIPAGEVVLVGLGSANRDPEQFEDPNRLNIARPGGAHGHLAFGHGIHYCLGAQLARMEGEVVFGRLLDRFPRMRLAVEPGRLRWRTSLLFRGVHELPVILDQ